MRNRKIRPNMFHFTYIILTHRLRPPIKQVYLVSTLLVECNLPLRISTEKLVMAKLTFHWSFAVLAFYRSSTHSVFKPAVTSLVHPRASIPYP